ncbi:MAG TPA: M14 family zinc carboxypeptidase [Solirubrobacteraceae bacterium]|nr:M14 family zinc carboxypeptidase [Solirubrobacteraceae bacterium]
MGPPTAGAATVPDVLLDPQKALAGAIAANPGTTEKACHASYRPDAPGVGARSFDTAGVGHLQVRTSGANGDWDLAVFDTAGNVLASGASPDAQEIGEGWTGGAGPVRVQVCRRSGEAEALDVQATFERLDPQAEATDADVPQLVSVQTPTRADKDALVALGLDMTEHGGAESLGVVLHGDADRKVLRDAGFEWQIKVPDMVRQDVEHRAAERRQAARATRSTRAAVPSGRTTYRTLAEYEAELKQLAADNPGLVKLITLPEKTLLGRDVLGVEIAKDVDRKDGRPAFFNMGVHHAREWPAGEATMEWAYELVNGFKSGDPRATNVVTNSRNLVVPIVNPDGFNASRMLGPAAGRDEAIDDTVYLVAGAATGGEYRRKNCRLGDLNAANCTTSVGLAENGTDPNRNYAGFWGGPGADTNPLTQTYRGPGPFSEVESRNIQKLVSANQVMSLITNHTTAGLILRAPGLAAVGDPVDENKGYKALGDAIGKENGYFSQKSFELYDTTGTTEDWSYNATGGFGFTMEIYCGAPNYETGDCDDPAFHPTYKTGVTDEWNGDSAQANHASDPGPDKGYDGKGNREAYYLAAESAIDETRHSILQGEAPAGATLRLTKAFKTETFPQADGNPLTVDDRLETTYEVDGSGGFRWHVNPSTRPVVAKEVGEPGGGEPSPPETFSGGIGGQGDGAAVPSNDAETDNTLSYNDHPITIPASGDNRTVSVKVTWTTPVSDWDLKLYEDANGNGASDPGERVAAVSQQGATSEEELTIAGADVQPGRKYVLRVVNFAAVESYEGTVTYGGPLPYQPARRESWTISCEIGGQTVLSQEVEIDRGQIKAMAPCSRVGSELVTPGTGSGSRTGTGTSVAGKTTPATPAAPAPSCVASSGFASVGARRSGRGVTLSLARKVSAAATVSVFQQSAGRQITGERLVARFANRTGTFTWNGRATQKGRTVTDGFYFVRFSVPVGGGQSDVRRVALQRTGGRFVVRPTFYRRATCDALESFKLERPVFGGPTNRALNVSFRLASPARVTVTVLKGTRTIRTLGPTNRRAGVTHRLRLDATGLARGEYRVRLSAVVGGKTLTSVLTARRL